MATHLNPLVKILLLLLLLTACLPNQASQPAAPESRPPAVRALAVDPRDGRLLKASADGLYESRDDGTPKGGAASLTPIALPAEIAAKGVSHVAIRRDQPDIVYIAGEQIGIWRTRDAGKTWQKVTRGLTNERVAALAVHSNGYPRDSAKSLFAWVADVGMFESHDEGDSWKRSTDRGMGLDNRPVTALTHSPLEGSMNTGWLYASTPGGAFLSMD